MLALYFAMLAWSNPELSVMSHPPQKSPLVTSQRWSEVRKKLLLNCLTAFVQL